MSERIDGMEIGSDKTLNDVAELMEAIEGSGWRVAEYELDVEEWMPPEIEITVEPFDDQQELDDAR